MSVLAREAVATVAAEGEAAARPSVLRRARVALGSLFVALAFAVGSVPAANASSTDLTGGEGDTFFTTITSYFTDHVLGSVLTLLALMVGVGVLISWGRKAAARPSTHQASARPLA